MSYRLWVMGYKIFSIANHKSLVFKGLNFHQKPCDLCVNLCVPCVKFNHKVHKVLHKGHKAG